MHSVIAIVLVLLAQEKPRLTDYFPPAEDQGGWRTLLPEGGVPGPAE